ncbi:MAG: fatty acid desaturase CarF family protein [Elusimicrobiota bacterium]|nr:fatty acid desaturase CarF family protein [Elusimicrobiota bacterium]
MILCFLPGLNPVLLYTLVYTGMLSSVAEVSHYLAHNSNSPVAGFLARTGLLLPKRRHARHHLEDNVSYTFLNGATDPLVDMIARRYSAGYKNGTDLHYSKYIPQAAAR